MRAQNTTTVTQFILQLWKYPKISKNILSVFILPQFNFAVTWLIRIYGVIEEELQLPNIYFYFHFVPFYKVRRIKMRKSYCPIRISKYSCICHVMSFFTERALHNQKIIIFLSQVCEEAQGYISWSLCLKLLIFIVKIISPLLQNNVKIMDEMLVKSSQFGVRKEIHFSGE